MLHTARLLANGSTIVGRSLAGRSNPFSSSSSSSSMSLIRNRSAVRSRNILAKKTTPTSALRSMTSKAKPSAKSELSSAAAAKTRAGSGKVSAGAPYIKDRGPVSWPSLFLVGIAAASIVAYYNIERERRLESAMGRVVSSESDGWSPNPGVMAPRKFKLTPWGYFPEDDGFGPSGKPAIGGPWSLVDLNGNLVTNASFQGKWLLLYFGFARCPDICPSEMLKLARVIDQLKETHPQLASKLVPVFVSVDPARDSLTALREYAKDFHPNYVFLTGSPTQVQEMAKKYRVYVSKAEETDDGDYLVDHSIVVYFHDDKGELSDCFTQSMRPKDISEKIVEKMTTPEGLVA
mmetsp:Transcript_21049/g.58527  ORF Transcript_21049/g.58527 Transcript_21049/m.58527 type:complete len:348 (-) Transcript_21049:1011-2054(-)